MFSTSIFLYILGLLLSTVTAFFKFPFLKAVMEPSRAPLAELPAAGGGAGAATAGGGGGGDDGRLVGGGGGGEAVLGVGGGAGAGGLDGVLVVSSVEGVGVG